MQDSDIKALETLRQKQEELQKQQALSKKLELELVEAREDNDMNIEAI